MIEDSIDVYSIHLTPFILFVFFLPHFPESFDDDEDINTEYGTKQAFSPFLIIFFASISIMIVTILMILIIVRVKSNRIVSQISGANSRDQRGEYQYLSMYSLISCMFAIPFDH